MPAFIAHPLHFPTSFFFLLLAYYHAAHGRNAKVCCPPPNISLKFTYDKMPTKYLLTAGKVAL